MPISEINAPDGSVLEIEHPDGASEEDILSYARENYQSLVEPSTPADLAVPVEEPPADEDEESLWEQTKFVAGLPGQLKAAAIGGLAKGVLGVPSGLASLADAATDLAGYEEMVDSGQQNELIRMADAGKEAIDKYYGVGEDYKDLWVVNLAEAMGQLGAFFIPGLGAAKGAALLGAGVKGIAAAGTATAAGQGALLAADEGRQRIENLRQMGVEVDEDAADRGVLIHSAVGTSEAIPFFRLFSKISKHLPPGVKEKVFREFKSKALNTFKSAASQGFAEGTQEMLAGVAQDAVELGIYNPEDDRSILNRETMWDEFTLGGAAGGIMDAITTGALGRRGRITRSAEREREAQFREREEEDANRFLEMAEAAKLEGEAQRVAAIEGAALEAEEMTLARQATREGEALQASAQVDPATILYESEADVASGRVPRPDAMRNYAARIARDVTRSGIDAFPSSGRFDVTEREGTDEQGNPEVLYEVEHAETNQQYGQSFRDREDAVHLMSNLNGQIRTKNLDRSLLDSIHLSPETYNDTQAQTLFVLGQRVSDPKHNTITSAALNHAAGTVDSPTNPYNEGATLDSLQIEQFGVPAIGSGKRKYYQPLNNLTAAQQINFDRVNRGLPETDTFTLEEARGVLDNRFPQLFDILVAARAEDPTTLVPTKEFAFDKDARDQIREALESKNITSALDSPEIKRLAEVFTGDANIKDMSAAQRRHFYYSALSLPSLDSPTRLPDFTPRLYNREQFAAATKAVQETGDGTIENIVDVLGPIGTETQTRSVARQLQGELKSQGVIAADETVPSFEVLPAPEISPTVEIPDVEPEQVSDDLIVLRRNLGEVLSGFGLNDVGLNVDEVLKSGLVTEEGEVIPIDDPEAAARMESDIKGAKGYYLPYANRIFLALDRIDPKGTETTLEARQAAMADVLNHEVVHAIRMMDLWTEKEWTGLENLAKKRTRQGNVTYYNDAQETYRGRPGMTPVQIMEEAVANLIKDARAKPRLITGKPRGLVNRMYEFFERMRSSLKGTGFQSFGDIMGRLEAGEVGARERGQIRTLRATERAQQAVPERGIGRPRDVMDLPLGVTADQPLAQRDRVGTTGQYIGAPPGVDTPQKLGALTRAMRGLTREGVPARFWYERSSQALLDITGGDRREADLLAQAIAVTSPGTPVGSNFGFAVQAYYQFKNGQPIRTGKFPTEMSKKLEDIFAGNDWEGRKTNNFYNNLMRVIDPSKVQGVTTDIWMMRALGYDAEAPSPRQYDFVQEEIERIADEMDWEPQQVQAAIWVAQKAKAKGVAAEEMTFDYSDAAQNNLGQVSWESIPGRTTGHMSEVFDADYPILQDYHVQMSKAFLDENGNDIIAARLGILSPGDFEAPGFFEGRVSPGTQTLVLAPKKYKAQKEEFREIEPAAADLIEGYAVARSILLKQDAAAYHRPFFDKSIPKKNKNGVEIDIGRPLSERETKALAAEMERLSRSTEYAPISIQNGARLINFDHLPADNQTFQRLVDQAVRNITFDGDVAVNAKLFAANSGYFENNWEQSKNGEDYLDRSLGGRSDIQRRVRDIVTEVQSRIDEVDAGFAEKYGWTPNPEINAAYRGEGRGPDLATPSLELRTSELEGAQREIDAAIDRSPEDSVRRAVDEELTRPVLEENAEEGNQPPATFQNKTYNVGDKILYHVADKFIGLKNVESAINKWREQRGLAPLRSLESAYQGEERLAGKIGDEIREFRSNRQEPLARKIAAANESMDVTVDEVDDYLMLRHAIERNEAIVARDASRDPEAEPGAGALSTGERLSDGFVKDRMKNRYGMDWDDSSGTWSGGNERGQLLQDIAADTDQIIKDSNERLVKGGLLSRADADLVGGFYKYYTPLRGKDMEDDIAATFIGGGGLSAKGSEYMRAKGRESAAESPLGHIMLNAERAISRANKNKEFGQSFVNLIKENPNNDFWEVISPENPRYTQEFEKRYTYIGDNPNIPKGTTASDPSAFPDKKHWVQQLVLRQNSGIAQNRDLLHVKEDGKTVYVDIKGDRRLRNAMLSLDGSTAADLVSKFGIVNRWLSMVNTSLNPEFVIGNFERDIQTAVYNLLGEQNMPGGKAAGERLIGKVLRDTPHSMGVFYRGLRRWNPKDGTLGSVLGLSAKDQADFREFMEAGAKADWFHTRPAEDQAKTIERLVEMERGTFKGNFQRRYYAIKDFVEDTNSAVENAVRLSTFKAGRDALLDAGVDRAEAVAKAGSLAKNLTINFNRKGMAGDYLNSAYLFFNAGVQGTMNFARGLFGPRGNPFSAEASRVKQGAVGSMIAMGSLLAMKAEEESEEDPETGRSYYSQIEPYIKERNIVIMKENGKDYWLIPLPYGYNIFHVLGANIYEVTKGLKSKEEAASDLLNTMLGSFSPVGVYTESKDFWTSVLKTALPTVATPGFEIATNENFFGAPIKRENLPLADSPQYPASALSRRSTATAFKNAATFLNSLTGGNEYEPGWLDVSPESMEHLYEYALGGAGTFGLRTSKAVKKWATGEDIDYRETPFIRRVMREPTTAMNQREYFDRREKLRRKEAARSGMRGKERVNYIKENKPYLRMIGRLDNAQKQIRSVNEQLKKVREAAGQGPTRAAWAARREEELYEKMNTIYARFNKAYDERVGRTK